MRLSALIELERRADGMWACDDVYGFGAELLLNPGSRGAQWGEVGSPEAEVGESMLPSSEGFLTDDLGPDVNLDRNALPMLHMAFSTLSGKREGLEGESSPP